nr:c-type cytochrome [Neoroseomonas terrae]
MRLLTATAALAVAFCGSTVAQDAARGGSLAAERCAACHGDNGRSQMPETPSLAGQHASFVTLQMILIREGIRQVPAMAAVTEGMADKDIEDLAAYFASLPPGPPDDRPARDAALYAAGEAVIGPRRCGVCHLPALTGREQVPRIVGQREEYLLRAMTEYRDGQRVGADAQMNSAMVGISNAEIAALAHFLAQHD